jgi:hypothetical protein
VLPSYDSKNAHRYVVFESNKLGVVPPHRIQRSILYYYFNILNKFCVTKNQQIHYEEVPKNQRELDNSKIKASE